MLFIILNCYIFRQIDWTNQHEKLTLCYIYKLKWKGHQLQKLLKQEESGVEGRSLHQDTDQRGSPQCHQPSQPPSSSQHLTLDHLNSTQFSLLPLLVQGIQEDRIVWQVKKKRLFNSITNEYIDTRLSQSLRVVSRDVGSFSINRINQGIVLSSR